MLSNDVLLEIYDEDIDGVFEPFIDPRMEGWITLAHVCRRWRSVVFQSPRRLNLRPFVHPNTCEGHPGHLTAFASHHL